ncbi:hypothetical protein APHAL10511_004986 [Amanita phalloides]|nr:hypothetical protein APHAL10511_004986 [Amanita phalloides]
MLRRTGLTVFIVAVFALSPETRSRQQSTRNAPANKVTFQCISMQASDNSLWWPTFNASSTDIQNPNFLQPNFSKNALQTTFATIKLSGIKWTEIRSEPYSSWYLWLMSSDCTVNEPGHTYDPLQSPTSRDLARGFSWNYWSTNVRSMMYWDIVDIGGIKVTGMIFGSATDIIGMAANITRSFVHAHWFRSAMLQNQNMNPVFAFYDLSRNGRHRISHWRDRGILSYR